MSDYRIHTLDSAPEKSRPALQGLQQSLGVVPNLAATMAESPVLLAAFVGAFGTFHGGTFDNAQRQALLLANAVANSCVWAVAFHSTQALREGVAAGDVAAIRGRRLPLEPSLAALCALSWALIESRGHVGEPALAAFRAAGFTPAQVLEVIAGISVSTLANYAGNVTHPELEQAFQAQAWRPQ